MRSCATFRTFPKTVPIFCISDMFTSKLFPKLIGSPSLGKLNGSKAAIQNSKKCSSMRNTMWESSSRKFTEIMLSPLKIKSLWVLDIWTITCTFHSALSVSCSMLQLFNMDLQQCLSFYEALYTKWPSNNLSSPRASAIKLFTTRCTQTATFLTGFQLWPLNLRATKWPMTWFCGRAKSLQQNFTTERALNSMTTCSIGDSGTAETLKGVTSSCWRMKITLGERCEELRKSFNFSVGSEQDSLDSITHFL